MYESARKSYLQMLDHVHNQGLRLCHGAFRTSHVESLYTNFVWVLNVAISTLCFKDPTHDRVFDHKYIKLFDARPNAIRTFGHRIKQFLTASNIDISDILETPSYFVSHNGRGFRFQDDSARAHKYRIVTNYLQAQHITTLPWP